MIISAAKIFSIFYENLNDWRKVMLILIFILFPIGLVLLQPDLGTSIVFLPIYLGILFFTPIKKKIIVLIILSLVLLSTVSLVNSYLYLNNLEQEIAQFISLKWFWILICLFLLLITLLISNLKYFLAESFSQRFNSLFNYCLWKSLFIFYY